jgi:hypothetical protein
MMIQRLVAETKAKVAFACALIAASIRQVEQTWSFAVRYFRNAPFGLHAGNKRTPPPPRGRIKGAATQLALNAELAGCLRGRDVRTSKCFFGLPQGRSRPRSVWMALPFRRGASRYASLADLYCPLRMAFLRCCYHQILGPRRHLPKFSNSLCRHAGASVRLNPHLGWQAAESYVERSDILALILGHRVLADCLVGSTAEQSDELMSPS